jgi:hypothetical protein
VRRTWTEVRGGEPHALMVGPVPVSPWTKQVIIDAGDHYRTGTFSWLQARVVFYPEQIPKNGTIPDVDLARRDDNVRAFLVWSRFPFWTLEPESRGTRVTVSDMRFAGRSGFSAWTMVGK